MVDKKIKDVPADPAPKRGGRGDDEIERFRQMLARDPGSLVFAALAEAYRRRKRTKEAIATCKKGLRAHPNFVSGRVALARAYADAGKTKPALDELERAILAAPDNLIAHRLLADIYRENRQVDQLERTLHRILALDTGDGESRKELESIQAQRVRDVEEGAADAKREIVTRTLAEIYSAQGYFEKAFDMFQKLSWQDPENAVLHERLADLKAKVIQRTGRAKVEKKRPESSPA